MTNETPTALLSTADNAGGCDGQAPEGTSECADRVHSDARECLPTAPPPRLEAIPSRPKARLRSGSSVAMFGFQPHWFDLR